MLKSESATHFANNVESESLYYSILGEIFYDDTLFGGVHKVYENPEAGILGVTIDADNSKIYWSESSFTSTGSIVRSDLDGGNVEVFYDSGSEIPRGLTIDPLNSELYVAYDIQDKILRFDLTQSIGSVLPSTFTAGINFP